MPKGGGWRKVNRFVRRYEIQAKKFVDFFHRKRRMPKQCDLAGLEMQ
jgi:hypothetical protein